MSPINGDMKTGTLLTKACQISVFITLDSLRSCPRWRPTPEPLLMQPAVSVQCLGHAKTRPQQYLQPRLQRASGECHSSLSRWVHGSQRVAFLCLQ